MNSDGEKKDDEPRTRLKCGLCRYWRGGFNEKCELRETVAHYRDRACQEFKHK